MLFVLMMNSFAQHFSGPATGKITGYITLNTDDFSNSKSFENNQPKPRKKAEDGIVNFNLFGDDINHELIERQEAIFKTERNTTANLNEYLNFEGPSIDGNSCWVPDCNISPGPSDVLIAINTTFWITDKQGNPLKKIDANEWYSNFVGDGLVFDPKSFYDYRSNRFYLMYLYFERATKTTQFMISVSDDSTAEGNWNNWVFPADLNGKDPVEIWADFPSMVINEETLSIAVDMFEYNEVNPVYSKLRVIQLSDLLQENPVEINYTDFWDFRSPTQPNLTIRTLKLVHDFDSNGNIYLTGFDVNQFAQNYIVVYEIEDVFGDVNINGIRVETSEFSLTPHMQQKDGVYPMQLFHLFYSEMVLRHEKIYIAHSTRDGSLASIHYMEVNINNWTLDNELLIGKRNSFYGYPDLIVDENKNVFMVYQRTNSLEYPGVFYSVKTADSENFGIDVPLMLGQGDMSKIGCGSQNQYIRFCDYTDIMFDPSDQNKVWLMGEYIGADNRWKTRVGVISLNQTVNISDENIIEDKFRLKQNYPNPFNPSTTISYSIPTESFVSLKIYNLLGSEIKSLINEYKNPGDHNYILNASSMSTGVYFYKIVAGNFTKTRKMILSK